MGGKALKAFLCAAGEEIVIGHSIERLCHSASKFDTEFSEKVKSWAILDGYYVPTRHPNSLPGSIPARVYTEKAAEEAALLAEEISQFARLKIEEMEREIE